MNKILVIGSTGNVGRALIEELAWTGEHGMEVRLGVSYDRRLQTLSKREVSPWPLEVFPQHWLSPLRPCWSIGRVIAD